MIPLDISSLMSDGNEAYIEAQNLIEGRFSFENERSIANRKMRWGLRRQARRLCSLGMQQPVGRFTGQHSININEIVGTENRGDEFDIEFHPLSSHLEDRWVKVWMAHMQGYPLPPVELLYKDGAYYVRDGHHRISVARAMGMDMIEAIVTELPAA